MACSHISEICSSVLKSRLGFPLLLSSTEGAAGNRSSLEPKIRFEANHARWFGSNLATQPAQLKIIDYSITMSDMNYRVTNSSVFELVPGQDKLSLTVCILDNQFNVINGLDYTCRMLFFTAGTVNCNEESSLLPSAYFSMDYISGVFQIGEFSLVCPFGRKNVIVQVSLVAQDSLLDAFSVSCKPCSVGHSITLGADGRVWWCSRCNPNQYVLDPNNPSFGCEVRYTRVRVRYDLYVV